MFLEISQKFTGKHLYQILFLNKVAGFTEHSLIAQFQQIQYVNRKFLLQTLNFKLRTLDLDFCVEVFQFQENQATYVCTYLLIYIFIYLFMLGSCLCDIWKPSYCLALYLTDVHFQGELQHFGHVGEQKIKCRPIRTRKIASLRLYEELYARIHHYHSYNERYRLMQAYKFFAIVGLYFTKQDLKYH